MMMTNYVSCEDCAYQEECHQFDAFFGCTEGKNKIREINVIDDDELTILNNRIINLED